MAKRKSGRNSSTVRGRHSVYSQRIPVQITSNHVRHLYETEKRLTRDASDVAKRSLSLAEDLRRHTPQKDVFHNVDGSPASITYKPVVQKKTLLRKVVLYGVMCLVSFILGVLLSAHVEIYANKYYSLIKFW